MKIKTPVFFFLVWVTAVAAGGCKLPAGYVLDDAGYIPGPNAVCDPFGEGQAQAEHGLIGSLGYLPASAVKSRLTLERFATHEVRLENPLLLSQVNVPTQLFSRGFKTRDGQLLKNEKGETLFEYFGMHLESEIRLAPEDKEGLYQFALLSDDGALLEVSRDGKEFHRLIDNDGVHMAKLGCASKVVGFQRNTVLPMRLHYFQGPRHHIAFMLLWRRIPVDLAAIPRDFEHEYEFADGDVRNYRCDKEGSHTDWGRLLQQIRRYMKDSICGLSGNYSFFNPDKVPSKATPLWLSLLARGWQVVPPKNFYLPREAGPNPCANPLPSPSPSPVPSSSPTPTPTITADPEPTPTPTVTADPEPTPTPTVTADPEPTPTPTVTADPEPTPTPTMTVDPEPTPTPTVTADPEPTPTPTVTADPEPTPTPTMTADPEPTPTATPLPTPSVDPLPTSTPRIDPTPTPTFEPEPSPTPTQTPCFGPGCGGGWIGV